MANHKIYLSGSGFWVVESLPYRGDEAVDVFPSYNYGMFECSKRNLATVRENSTAREKMTWNGKPSRSYESYYTSDIQRLEEKLAESPRRHA